MAYLVNITARAERDLVALYEDIDAASSLAALRWYEGLRREILDLENTPYSWPGTHETRKLRNVLYGRKPHSIYRVIYRILEKRKTVEVLHIRHGARRPFRASDLK